MTPPSAPVAVWRSVRALPDFWRLLELRLASQFGDGLFQAGLAGALLFNPERASSPLAIAGAFAVLFLPYSLLGPFAGALMDRWDRRLVLIAANAGRVASVAVVGICLALGARDFFVLCGALVVNGLARFVAVGAVGCAARRGSPGASRHDELDRVGARRGRGISGRQLHAGAALAVRLR